jgi:hypothetical protein
MDYKDIQKNINKVKIGNINIDKNKNIMIPILYDNIELSIKIPKSKNNYFKIHQLHFNNEFFNNYLTLELMENMDEFEEEYKNDAEKITNQKEAVDFSNFIIELKDKIIKCFFNKLKINKNYLNIVDFNELNLEEHEINKAIWNENIDFSYIPEIKEIEENILDNDDDMKIETTLRNIFHVNKNNKKDKDLILKSDIIFINKKLEYKKHIYINWYII